MTKEQTLKYLKRKIGVRRYLKIKKQVYKELYLHRPEYRKNYIKLVIAGWKLAKDGGFKVNRIKFSKNKMVYKRRVRND